MLFDRLSEFFDIPGEVSKVLGNTLDYNFLTNLGLDVSEFALSDLSRKLVSGVGAGATGILTKYYLDKPRNQAKAMGIMVSLLNSLIDPSPEGIGELRLNVKDIVSGAKLGDWGTFGGAFVKDLEEVAKSLGFSMEEEEGEEGGGLFTFKETGEEETKAGAGAEEKARYY